MGREATRVFQIIAFVAPLLSGQALAQGSSGDEDYRRLWIEERRETTVCQVNAELLEARVRELEEQLAVTRDALERVRGVEEPGEIAKGALETAAAPGAAILEEELEEPQAPEPVVADVGSAAPPATASPPPTSSGGTEPPTAEALALYDEGYTLFHENRYEEAEARFASFVQSFPNTELTDNAQFWIGECRYARGAHEDALNAFVQTVERFPNGNKVPDAMLKAGKSLSAMGDTEAALATYEEVVSRFPESAAAAAAKELLAAAGG